MSTMIIEIYDALKIAGVPDDKAKAAAQSVPSIEQQAALVTKQDLAELETRLVRTILTAMIGMTAVFAAIVKLF